MRFAAIALLAALALAGCKREVPAPQPSESAAPATPEAAPASSMVAPAPGSAEPTGAALDTGALHERRDPVRLLRFYTAALEQGRWDLAAQAWHRDSGVTAATLKASYDRGRILRLTFGAAEVEGGAGSLYYEAPVQLRFGDDAPQQGTLTLRRVNDVPGATQAQLDWHIEQSTIGAGQ